MHELAINDTNIHDIPIERGINHTVSIKSTKTDSVMLGDICRFYNYDFTNEQHIMIIYQYSQATSSKLKVTIYKMNYTKEIHKILFGNIQLEEILSLKTKIENIKDIDSERDSIYE